MSARSGWVWIARAAAALLMVAAIYEWWSAGRWDPSATIPDTLPAFAAIADRAVPEASERWAAEARNGNPFRHERRPTDERFSVHAVQPAQWVDEIVPETATAVPTLTAMIGGPPWGAVVEGLPGYETGILLYVGEPVGDLLLRSVHGETAIIVVGGATVSATMKKPWQ